MKKAKKSPANVSKLPTLDEASLKNVVGGTPAWFDPPTLPQPSGSTPHDA
jgi:hypothetical protein